LLTAHEGRQVRTLPTLMTDERFRTQHNFAALDKDSPDKVLKHFVSPGQALRLSSIQLECF
jgi:hypothetical protein